MNELKFACPVCGQHIRCDSSQRGAVMQCPTCFQNIVVPQTGATEGSKLVLTGMKAGGKTATRFGDTSDKGLAAAPAKGFPGSVVVIIIFLCIGAAIAFVYSGTIFKSRSKPSPAADAVQSNAVASAETDYWTLNLDNVTTPDSAATASVHGKVFTPARVVVDSGTLTLRTDNSGPPDAGISIYLRATLGDNLAGQTVDIKSTTARAPWVDLRWNNPQGAPMTQTVKSGYAMRIEFGQPLGNRLPGKIYLCTPDDDKSYIAGAFNAKIRNPKPTQ